MPVLAMTIFWYRITTQITKCNQKQSEVIGRSAKSSNLSKFAVPSVFSLKPNFKDQEK